MLYVAPHSRECGGMKPWNLWNLETKVIMIVLWNRQRSASVCPLRLCLSTTYEGYEERQFAFTSKYSGFKVSGFQFLLCIGISQFCWNLPMVSEGLFETKWLTKKALHSLSEWGRPRRASLCISAYSISVDSEGKWIVPTPIPDTSQRIPLSVQWYLSSSRRSSYQRGWREA